MQESYVIRIGAESFDWDDSCMFKSSICMFLDQRTSKSKILTFRGHLSVWMGAEIFELNISVSPNLQIEDFNI